MKMVMVVTWLLVKCAAAAFIFDIVGELSH